MQALNLRQSTRTFNARPLALQEWSNFLWAANGKQEKDFIAEVSSVLCDSAKYYFEAEKAKYHPNHYTDGSEHLEQPVRFREHLKVFDDLFHAGLRPLESS